MPSYSPNPVVEVHEERIQRLESGMQTVATTTALTNQKVDHLAVAVKEGFEAINSRLDKGTEQFEKHEVALAGQGIELKQLQQVERSRATRWASIRKAALPLLAAAAGVIATKSSENIWSWLASHLIH